MAFISANTASMEQALNPSAASFEPSPKPTPKTKAPKALAKAKGKGEKKEPAPKPAPKLTRKAKALKNLAKTQAKTKAKDEGKARFYARNLHRQSQVTDPASEAWFKSGPPPGHPNWQQLAWDTYFKRNPGIEPVTKAFLREGPCFERYLEVKPKFRFHEGEFPLLPGATATPAEAVADLETEEVADWAEDTSEDV